MNQRLIKEFRALALPGMTAAISAGFLSTRVLFDPGEQWGGGQALPSQVLVFSLYETAVFAIIFSLAALPAISFGAELQHRTLPLLLTQPIPRTRMWGDKMLALVLTVTITALIYVIGLSLAQWAGGKWMGRSLGMGQQLFNDSNVILGLFLAANLCSAAFWTFVARSTIGGIVLSAAAQFLGALAIILVLQRVYGDDIPLKDSIVLGCLSVFALVYAPAMLWFGRRKFQRLELRHTVFSEAGPQFETFAGVRWEPRWLVASESNSIANMVRKEVRLNKPLLLIAAVFCVCWLLTFGIFCLWPAYKHTLEAILAILTAIYTILVPWLAGCMSLAEDKALGLNAWHLTLPVSAKRQWWLKLLVGLMVGLGVGVLTPWLLGWLYAIKMHIAAGYLESTLDGIPVLILWGTVFLLSFWAASLVANLVRAALAGFLCLLGFIASSMLGVWCADQLGGLQCGAFLWLVTHTGLTPAAFVLRGGSDYYGPMGFLAGIFILTALAQAFFQFRRSQPERRALVKYATILAVMAFLAGLWVNDLIVSSRKVYESAPVAQLREAFISYVGNESEASLGLNSSISAEQLVREGKLTPSTKKWLDGAVVTRDLTPKRSSAGKRIYRVGIYFPAGGPAEFECEGSD